MVEAGQEAPDFTLLGDDGKPFHLNDARGKQVVLWFYPMADTPG